MCGAIVIDGTHHFSTLERYRKPNGPWHYSSTDTEFCLLWEVLFQDLLQVSQFGMSDHLFHHCCQTFPQFPIGCAKTEATVTNPQVSIKPPNSAVVAPETSIVEPSVISEFVDLARVMFIPVDDVQVILQKSGDERGRQWWL